MVRQLSVGFVLGLLTLVPLTIGTAAAGHAAWSAGSAAANKRVQFRPWSRYGRQAQALPRWRPHGAPSTRTSRALERLASPLVNAARARDPVLRGYATVSRAQPQQRMARAHQRDFRPQQQRGRQNADLAVLGSPPALQAQFRPTNNKRRQTYEQIMASSAGNYPAYPRVPSAYYSAPLGAYASYWPAR